MFGFKRFFTHACSPRKTYFPEDKRTCVCLNWLLYNVLICFTIAFPPFKVSPLTFPLFLWYFQLFLFLINNPISICATCINLYINISYPTSICATCINLYINISYPIFICATCINLCINISWKKQFHFSC